MILSFKNKYYFKHRTINNIMFLVIMSLIPGIICEYYYFGYGTLIQVILSILSALIIETIFLKIRNFPITNIKDNSAIVTAAILGISIPPLSPWWLVVIANIFSVGVAKHLYGGIGQNIFNPAMVGYMIVFVSFPIQINSKWHLINNNLQELTILDHINIIFEKNFITSSFKNYIDGISQATPLTYLKYHLNNNYTYISYKIKLSWIFINISFLLGGIFLIFIKIIKWHIPFFFIFSIFFCSILKFLFFSSNFSLLEDIQNNLFFGSTMIGAFFVATDPVTTSSNIKGKIIFSILSGMLSWIIRNFSNYPDGIGFAILIANSSVPIIDYYTEKKFFTERKYK